MMKITCLYLFLSLSAIVAHSAGIYPLLDTGKPADHLRTGGIVWEKQHLAIGFPIDKRSRLPMHFHSAHIPLNTENIVEPYNTVTLRICLDDNTGIKVPLTNDTVNGPDIVCLESESYRLFPDKYHPVHWISKKKPLLSSNNNYFLVVEGNAIDEESSFTWYDSENGTAHTAFMMDGTWIPDTDTKGALSALIMGR